MAEYSIVDILGGIADIGTKATPSDAFGCSLEYGIGGWIAIHHNSGQIPLSFCS